MRRLRPLRRRARQREQEQQEPEMTAFEAPPVDQPEEDSEYGPEEFEPFVPVSAGPGNYAEDEAGVTYPPLPSRHPRRLPRFRLPLPLWRRPIFGIEIRGGILLGAVALIVAGIFGTLLNQGRIRPDVEEWWPLVIVVGAVLWMLVVLIRRQVAAFLGGAALGGAGLSLLMDTQGIAESTDTLLGMVLVTVGLGIVIRGFLLRQRAPL